MPSGDKPYRVYRGGRARGKVPKAQKPPPQGERRERGFNFRPNRGWLRWIPVALGIFVVFLVVWGLASYFQFRNGVSDANKRLAGGARQALDDDHGSATDILLLGTDHAQLKGRESANRTDSITLLRVDKDKHRMAYLSIPRDLASRSPVTARGRSTRRCSSAALRSRSRPCACSPACRSTTSSSSTSTSSRI